MSVMASNAKVSSTTTEEICELVLDNPGRKNALSYALLDDLSKKLATAEEDAVRAVILTGAGDAFSAGADFADLTGWEQLRKETLESSERLERVSRAKESTKN